MASSTAFSPGILKQLLPYKISPDNDLFLSMFLIRLLPSMREAVGTSNHNQPGLWRKPGHIVHACSSKNLTVAATSAWHGRSPTSAKGKKGDKRGSSAQSKSRHSSPSIFHKFPDK
jgi:hypothetical protein